jgi:gliding motility-associated protein GldM
MAGLKETPRQKMIGMMYLVLTALLALQVSDALIQKFTLLNNSLEVANNSANDKNGSSLKGITEKANEKPGLYTDVVAQANEVRKISNEMIAYIDGIKAKAVEAGEGIDPETGQIKNPKEEEKINFLMIGPNKNGTAYELKTKLNEYATKLSKYSPTKFQPLAWDASEDKIVGKDPNNNKKDFAELNFAQTPVVAALATLSQKQTEVRRYESEVLDYLASKVGAKEIKFDKVFAMVSAKSNTVVAGTPYEAEMFIAASSSAVTPRMSWSGGGVSVVDGKGVIKFVAQGGSYDANGLAKKSYTATISYTGPDGLAKTVTKDQEYFVAKPTYNIETATLPALYLGCSNKLSIVSPGLGALWQPSFSGDGGEVIPNDGRGKVTVVPSSAQFTLNINNQGNLIGKENFKVRTVPRPDLKLYANGSEADEKKGIAASAIRFVEVKCFADESFKTTNPEDARFRPASVKVFLARGTRPLGSVEGSAGSISLGSLASNAQSGDRIVVEVKGVQRMNFKGAINEIPMNRLFNIPLN